MGTNDRAGESGFEFVTEAEPDADGPDDPDDESGIEKRDARRELRDLDPNAEDEARKVERQLRRMHHETL